MDIDDEHFDPIFGPGPLTFANSPMWSFDRASERFAQAQMIRAPPGSYYDGEDDLDDNASNKAVRGGDLSDSETPLAIFNDSHEEHGGEFSSRIYDDNTSLQNMMRPFNGDDEEEEMRVVELPVPDDDQANSSD
jgi:ubiquitin carboxyl-terminal hydrolase 4/11/15